MRLFPGFQDIKQKGGPVTQLARESVCRSALKLMEKRKKKGASVRVRVVCIVKSRRRFVLFGGNLVLENAQR